jgi:hypothetical protein
MGQHHKKKYIYIDHFVITKKIEVEMNNPLKGEMEKQPTKKDQIHMAMHLSIFSKRIVCSKNCLLRTRAC